jgi:hypothetical protein
VVPVAAAVRGLQLAHRQSLQLRYWPVPRPVTFDEAFPPFTYSGNSVPNSTIVAPNAATSVASDSAAETLFGHSVRYEPTGPNTPLARSGSGQELYPGPGYNSFADPPASCVTQTVPA